MHVVSITTILSLLGRKVEVEKYRGSRFHLIAFNMNAKYHNIDL